MRSLAGADPARSAIRSIKTATRAELRAVDYQFYFANIEPSESLLATNCDTSKTQGPRVVPIAMEPFVSALRTSCAR